MASNWISDIAWDEQGRPYRTYLMDTGGKKAGTRTYVAPAEVNPANTDDPRLLQWAQANQRPGQSFTKNAGRWNADTGAWDRGVNWSNLATAAVGGAIAAPFVVPALAGLGGGSAAATPIMAPASGGTLAATTAVPTSVAMTATPAAVGGGSAAVGGSGLVSALTNPKTIGAVGRGLGAYSQGQATNRGAEFGGQVDLEQLLLARERQQQDQLIQREQEGRASGNDAFKRLMLAQRVGNPGPRPQLSPYSVAPRQAGAPELQGADAMTQEVMKRLTGGNPIPMPVQHPLAVDPKLLKPGTAERITGYLSPFLSYFGGR